jgi:hypothetical protein
VQEVSALLNHAMDRILESKYDGRLTNRFILQFSNADSLTFSSTFRAEDSLFAHPGKHEIFMPLKTYPLMTVSDLASVKPINNTKPGGVSL